MATVDRLELTREQKRAVSALEGDLAVVAGAGAGKTRVLAHRFAHALTKGVAGQRSAADRLLMITFTTKAAAEIAERVRSVVRTEVTKGAGGRIEEAWISTIHGFCARLVRRHVMETGLEPYFGVADEFGAYTLKVEAFELAAREVMGDVPALGPAIEALGLSEIRARVIGCHDKATTLGLDPARTLIPMDLEELEPLVESVAARARDVREALEYATQSESVVRKRDRLEEWIGAFCACSLGDGGECGRLLDVCSSYDLSRLPAGAKHAHEQLKRAIQQLLVCARAFENRDAIEAIGELVRRYARTYAQVKKERGVADFEDLQREAAALLENDPVIAGRYREHFDLLMVDEFQDTNALQMRVLAPLRRDNLCIVGDERQSIYGFRYADVDIFRSEAARMGKSVPLADNFRSHPEILDFVNGLFSQAHLFGPEFLQLVPKRKEPAGRGVPIAGRRVECVRVGDSLGRTAARQSEAAYIAQRVRALLDDGFAPSDVCILLRGAGSATIYASALEELEIPVSVMAGASLYDEPEVRELISMLRVLAVPEDDQALLELLSGRMAALPDRVLLAIADAAGGSSLWTGMALLAEGRDAGIFAESGLSEDEGAAVVAIHELIGRLWSEQGDFALAEFIRRACYAFDYDLTLFALGPSGARAWDNVCKVMRLAAAYERAEGPDLAELVDHLKRRELISPDKPAASAGAEGAVRMMTVHSAKGLEFPVVFVADLAAAQRHAAPSVVVEAGEFEGRSVPVAGVRLPERPYGFATTGAYLRMAAAQREREVEEEKRCLYVACTRAREILVVSGACSLEKPPEEGSSLIDWVTQGLGVVTEGEASVGSSYIQVTTLDPEDSAGSQMGPPAREAHGPGPIFVVTEETEGALPELSMPSSVSYSALQRHEECPLSFHARYRLRLGSLAEFERSEALDFGSAAHRVLQESTLGRLNPACLAEISGAFGLTKERRERLATLTARFEETELCAVLRSADCVAVEEPFLTKLGQTVLTGAMDAVAWRGDCATILDYKTGDVPDQAGRATGVERYALQAECYALAALRTGASSVRVVFAFVEHDGVELSYEFGPSDERRISARLDGIVSELTQTPITHLTRYDSSACGTCPAYRTICPVKGPPPAMA